MVSPGTDTPPATASDPSLAHLVGRLQLVELRVRAAVERRRASDPDPTDRFRGLYISPAHAERLLAEPATASAEDGAAAERLRTVEADADATEQAGADLRLRRLARSFHLEPLDVELLLIALLPDLDARFERLYGYLQDNVALRRASIGLGLELCGVGGTDAAARNRILSSAPLVSTYLILVEDSDRPFLTRSLRVPDRVAAYLLGDDTLDPSVAALTGWYETAPVGDVEPLVRCLRSGRLGYLRERPGASAGALAVAAFARFTAPVLAIDLQRLRAEDDVRTVAGLAAREAGLQGAGLVAGPIEALVSRGLPALRAFSELPRQILLTGSGNWDPSWSRDVPFILETPLPDSSQRAQMWRSATTGDLPASLDPGPEMAPFLLSGEQVRRAARAGRLHAAGADRPLRLDDLRLGARAQNAAGLERLARRIEPAVRFEDLVLPADVIELLRELVARARRRERVLDEWRMGAASRRRGLAALFAGPSGTGKTMAAEVVAGALGLDLYVVDLATVVDKYVGETEKNLDRIFDQAEGVNGVLLFDEADALFGKRSEVRDAHDRYANVETAYLLQRMDRFNGVALLSSNLRSNLDEAFARRLDAVVDFPEPKEPYRRRLWEQSLRPPVPADDDIDFDFLARAFTLSGGNIRNIALTAAYLAADHDRSVTMADLIRGVQREYRKLGRLCVEAEFGPYYPLIAGEGN
ncbi:MAG TPA: ATP-binding protein [Candidatus Limnocylindrales bacterium]|nr:ATP-binding protein [Candidatus Limnocylindrales bacterium]